MTRGHLTRGQRQEVREIVDEAMSDQVAARRVRRRLAALKDSFSGVSSAEAVVVANDSPGEQAASDRLERHFSKATEILDQVSVEVLCQHTRDAEIVRVGARGVAPAWSGQSPEPPAGSPRDE
jgi:hypothetical protein